MSFNRTRILAVLLLTMPFAGSVAAKTAAPVITVAVDATEAPRRIFHAKLNIPIATPTADLTLFYPKWIPGEHGPTGPIQ